jgi:protein-S-isoprenylcysteine O-methyltransferase Ste14
MNRFTGDTHKAGSFFGKVGYGLLFVVVLPLVLIFWSAVLDRSIRWSVPASPLMGFGIGTLGAAILLKGMYDLLAYGHGLPMNAYPPERYVTEGIYAWFSHPIYLGTVILAAGIALAYQSSSGFYITTPLMAFMLVALVLGYERQAMEKHFGAIVQTHHPLFSLSLKEEKQATWIRKFTMILRVFGLWWILGYCIDYARYSAGSTGLFPFSIYDNNMALLWLVPYLYLALRILFANTEKQVFHDSLVASLATGASLYLYLLLLPFGVRINAWPEFLFISLFVTVFASIYPLIWELLRRAAESLANSRHDWLFANGRFRVINHSIYAGLGAALGTGIAAYLVGNNLAVFSVLLFSLVAAAVFAQVCWGSSSLLRPFGYWGAILGAIVGFWLSHLIFGIHLWSLALAGALGAPFVQALGRLRCLVQGCCHGIPIDEPLGIHVWHPQSRVCALSGLRGQSIHITQLYSILFNLLLAPLLWAMWISQAIPASMIVGMYLILTGIERFAEDAYRGEKQTKTVCGLKESQWVATVGLVLGFIAAIIPSDLPTGPLGHADIALGITMIIGGLLAAFAMGMDFPKSSKRFSRLSG